MSSSPRAELRLRSSAPMRRMRGGTHCPGRLQLADQVGVSVSIPVTCIYIVNPHLRVQGDIGEEVPTTAGASRRAGVSRVRRIFRPAQIGVHRSTVFCVWVSVVLISSPSWFDRSEIPGRLHAAAARRVAHCRRLLAGSPRRRITHRRGRSRSGGRACVRLRPRRHPEPLAFDLGVNRHDLVSSLDATTEGVSADRRRRGEGRLFLNNVCLGITATPFGGRPTVTPRRERCWSRPRTCSGRAPPRST